MAEGAKQTPEIAQPRSRVSILRRLFNWLPQPLAERIQARLNRGLRGRLIRAEYRLDEVDEDRQSSFWAREALVLRMNQTDAIAEARWQHLLALEAQMRNNEADRVTSLEVRVNELIWGREALVERANFMDARDHARALDIDERLRTLDAKLRTIENNGIIDMTPQDAAQLDTIALSRRLASIEDHVERLLEQLAQQGNEGDSQADDRPVVVFPQTSRKEAS